MIFTREPMITFINVLAILGLWYTIVSRKYQLSAWLLLIIFLDPRSADRISVFPVVLLAAIAVDQVLLPALTPECLRNTNSTLNNEEKKTIWGGQKFLLPLIFTMFCVLYPFILAYLQTFTPGSALTMLTAPQREAMDWIKNNTPDESVFVVMSSDLTWSSDKVSEWFPALTNRKNLLTVQGAEWLPNSVYKKNKQVYEDFKECADTGESCLSTLSKKYGEKLDYLVVSRINGSMQSLDTGLSYFDRTVEESGNYDRVYENEAVTVFKKK